MTYFAYLLFFMGSLIILTHFSFCFKPKLARRFTSLIGYLSIISLVLPISAVLLDIELMLSFWYLSYLFWFFFFSITVLEGYAPLFKRHLLFSYSLFFGILIIFLVDINTQIETLTLFIFTPVIIVCTIIFCYMILSSYLCNNRPIKNILFLLVFFNLFNIGYALLLFSIFHSIQVLSYLAHLILIISYLFYSHNIFLCIKIRWKS